MFKLARPELSLKIFKITLKLDIHNFACIRLITACMFDTNVYMALPEELALQILNIFQQTLIMYNRFFLLF